MPASPTLIDFSKYKIAGSVNAADLKFVKPLISNRNRLEGLPRTGEFDRSLRAEIADPLWMLCRQWQMGEFQGEDAATACQAKILAEHQQPTVIRSSNQQLVSYDVNQVPLEAKIECEQITPDLYLKLQMGRLFFKILTENQLQKYKAVFLKQFPIDFTADANDKEGLLLFESSKDAFPDGYKILTFHQQNSLINLLASGGSIPVADINTIQNLALPAFTAFYKNVYTQPDPKMKSWMPERMEYSFAIELPHQEGVNKVYLEADQYASGRLDWSSFDENLRQSVGQQVNQADNLTQVVQTFIPTPLKFGGMPHPRFWQMEESRTDFGKIEAGTTGILSMLIAEYGLTYSNDWFILPYLMKINTYCEVKGIMITDVFGQNILVEPTFKDPELQWQEFAVFRQTELKNLTSPRNRFYLAPSVLKTQQSEPLEKVNFMRDEMSNMVWAIESIVPSAAGGGRDVKLSQQRLDPNFTPAEPDTKIRYVLGTTVPENWIPFIPVQKKNSDQEIRLQRARIPNAALPISKLLTETQPVQFIEEEEISRAGVIVKRQFKRTRWLNGKTCLWIGRTKQTGRGEGWSGLMFDQILPVTKTRQ